MTASWALAWLTENGCMARLLNDSDYRLSLSFHRYLVPRDMSVGHFIYILSSRLHLAPGKALFVFVKNTLPQTGKY